MLYRPADWTTWTTWTVADDVGVTPAGCISFHSRWVGRLEQKFMDAGGWGGEMETGSAHWRCQPVPNLAPSCRTANEHAATGNRPP